MSIETVKSIIDLFFTELFIKETVIIEMNNFDCEHYYEKADIDNYSKISLKDELLVNHDYGNFYKSLSLKVSQINCKDIVKNFIKTDN